MRAPANRWAVNMPVVASAAEPLTLTVSAGWPGATVVVYPEAIRCQARTGHHVLLEHALPAQVLPPGPTRWRSRIGRHELIDEIRVPVGPGKLNGYRGVHRVARAAVARE